MQSLVILGPKIFGLWWSAVFRETVIGKYSLNAGNSSTEAARREAVVFCRTAVRDIRVRQALETR